MLYGTVVSCKLDNPWTNAYTAELRLPDGGIIFKPVPDFIAVGELVYLGPEPRFVSSDKRVRS